MPVTVYHSRQPLQAGDSSLGRARRNDVLGCCCASNVNLEPLRLDLLLKLLRITPVVYAQVRQEDQK
jgi:hypothetical protein